MSTPFVLAGRSGYRRRTPEGYISRNTCKAVRSNTCITYIFGLAVGDIIVNLQIAGCGKAAGAVNIDWRDRGGIWDAGLQLGGRQIHAHAERPRPQVRGGDQNRISRAPIPIEILRQGALA